MRIAVVVGVRPHFIKLSVLYHQLIKQHEVFVIHTGQHFDYELSDIFFNQLGLPNPEYHLMVRSETQAEQVGRSLIQIERVLKQRMPDILLVIGDANPGLAGALAAAKLGISVAHIEAGSRNNDLKTPEEVNTVVIDSVSSLFFCSTRRAVTNLEQRKIVDHVYFTGDLLLDCIKNNIDHAERTSRIMEQLGLNSKNYLLVTAHRVRNMSISKLSALVEVIGSLRERIILPMHPRTRTALLQHGLMDLLTSRSNLTIIQPQSYLDMLVLLKHARIAMTDSSGLQREAFCLETPCIILRESTEYPETIEHNCAIMTGIDKERILNAISYKWSDSPIYFDKSIFGDGTAVGRISAVLSDCRLTKSVLSQ